MALLLACYDCNPSSASGKGDLPAEQPQQQAGSGDAPSRLPPVFLGRLRVENGEVLPADGRQVRTGGTAGLGSGYRVAGK